MEPNESKQNQLSSTVEPLDVETSPIPPKKRKKWWGVLVSWVVGIIMSLGLLLSIATVLLYYPPVQKAVVNKVAQSLRKTIGLDITIGKIRIAFPIRLKIGDVTALTAEGDTVAIVGELTAHLGVTPLLKGELIPLTGFTLRETMLNYQTPGDSLSLRGNVHEITISELIFGLQSQRLSVGEIALKEVNMDVVALIDTLTHTSDEPSAMVIEVDQVVLDRVRWSFSSSYDSVLVGGFVEHGMLSDGLVDLPRSYYGAKYLDVKGDLKAVGTELDFLPLPWKYRIKGHNAYYGGEHNIKATVDEVAFEAGDGWRIREGRFEYIKDSTHMHLWGLNLVLPGTRIQGSAELPFSEWLPDTAGMAEVKLLGRVSMPEFERFMGDVRGLPTDPVDVNVRVNGSLEEKVNFLVDLRAKQTLDLYVKGDASYVFDPKKRRADALFTLKTDVEAMRMLTTVMHKGAEAEAPSWRIPAGVNLSGTAHITPMVMSADIDLFTPEGQMVGTASYAPSSQAYDAHMNIRELNVQQFLPGDTIRNVSGIIQAKGRGIDPFSPKTSWIFLAKVDTLNYNAIGLKELTVLSELKNNQLFAAINSENEALKLTAQADAILKKNDVNGSINLYVDSIIPSQLGLNIPVVHGGRLELRSGIRSDLKQYYDFKGEVENFLIQTDRGVLNPTNTYITALTTDSSMMAGISSGDLALDFRAYNGLKDFTNRVTGVMEAMRSTLKDTITTVDMRPWMNLYPDTDLKLSMGRNNLLRTYLDELRIGAKSVGLELTTRTHEGLTLDGYVADFQKDTFKINNVDIILRQDTSFFYATATAHKEKFRNQLPFDIVASVMSNVHRSEMYLNWIDHRQRDFVKLGMELWSRSNGDLELGFTPDPIVLAYNPFTSEGKGLLRLPHGQDNKLEADVRLRSSNGALIAVHNVPSSEGHLIQAQVERFQLTMLKSLNLLPPIEGIVDANVDWLQRPDKVNEYELKIGIQDFKYDDREVGLLTADGRARQIQGDTYAEANLLLDNKDVAYVEYMELKSQPKKPRMRAQVEHLPLDKVNPFLPVKYAQMKGTLDAILSNYNITENIEVATAGEYRGQIRLGGAELYVPALNETYNLDSKPIVVSDGYVILNDYALSANDARLTMSGSTRLTPDLPLDFAIKGRGIQLLNSDPTPESILHGKVNIDADLRVKGPVRAFNLTGELSLLGSTDVTYQSQKSDLKNRNNYDGLVEFTDFADTLFVNKMVTVDSLSLGGMSIDLGVRIAPATQVTAILSRNGGNMVSLQGGGDFNLKMSPYGTMQLSGIYRVNRGQVHLTFSPLSRKFDVRQGSQIAWNGELLKPAIDFRATSRVSTRVTLPNEPSRLVDFDVSIIAENTLNDLKLRFVTESPEDLSMSNRLRSLSDDEQSRQSLLLLGTGYFMGGQQAQNRSSTSVINDALTALLASQINSLAGEALDAEINFGITDGTTNRGQGTNYSYSISKRFLNNRINFVVGGKVMTGQAAEGLQQTIIDNMSLEYQIDENGTRFLRLFHKKNFENLLDGEMTETGGGYVIRRRLGRLGDLFKFRPRKTNTPSDSIPVPNLVPQAQNTAAPKPSQEDEKKKRDNDEEAY